MITASDAYFKTFSKNKNGEVDRYLISIEARINDSIEHGKYSVEWATCNPSETYDERYYHSVAKLLSDKLLHFGYNVKYEIDYVRETYGSIPWRECSFFTPNLLMLVLTISWDIE